MRLPIQIEAIIYKLKENKPKFLILKRIPSKDGFWQPVSGGLESEETVEECLYREIKEETGITKNKILRVIPLEYFFQFKDTNFRLEEETTMSEYAFGVEIDSKIEEIDIEHNPVREHEKYEWLEYEDAKKRLFWDDNKNTLKELWKRLTGEKNED